MPDEKSKFRGAPFVMPSDVVKRLGNGETVVGLATLRDTFGIPLDGPPDVIPADKVEAIGGRQVLQKFIAKVRSQRRASA